jgi:hypothetical protein
MRSRARVSRRITPRHRIASPSRLAATIRAVPVPDLGRFSGSATRRRVGARLPRHRIAIPSRLAATIRAVPVPDLGRFIGSTSRTGVGAEVSENF